MEVFVSKLSQEEIENGIANLGMNKFQQGVATINCRATFAIARQNDPEAASIWSAIANLTYYMNSGEIAGAAGTYVCGHSSEETQTVPEAGRQSQIVYPSIRR